MCCVTRLHRLAVSAPATDVMRNGYPNRWIRQALLTFSELHRNRIVMEISSSNAPMLFSDETKYRLQTF